MSIVDGKFVLILDLHISANLIQLRYLNKSTKQNLQNLFQLDDHKPRLNDINSVVGGLQLVISHTDGK